MKLISFLTDDGKPDGKLNEQRVESAARVHDYFNIAATSVMTTITFAARVNGLWNLRLAYVMAAYLIFDCVWLGLLPEIVGSGASGGAAMLLSHHFAAIGVAWHAATFPLHTRYTSYMAVVEVNTLLLLLKKHMPGKQVKAVLDKMFMATWVGLRLVWFPLLLMWLILPGQVYPSLFRRLFCTGCAMWLAALQFLWTWNFLVPVEKRVNLC